VRQRAVADLGAELAAQLDRALHGLAHAGLDRLVLVELARHSDAQSLQVFALRQLDRIRQLDGGRVGRVTARDDRVEVGAVAHVARNRTDLVEARRERDGSVPRDGPVRGPEADVAAERGRAA